MKETDRDLLVFSGAIESENSDDFIDKLVSYKAPRRRAALFLCTYGGDPHAAYRIARALHRRYPVDIRILIPSYCKSAGTMIALCANSLGFSDFGELGPLDTQLTRPDEIDQRASGLEVFSTLRYLTDHAFACFEQNLLTILRRSGHSISTRLASEIATKLATGLVEPITAQLDPHRIGIAQRGLEVTKAYGKQLANMENMRYDAETVVGHLVNDYPTHAFVIDREEAGTLFKNVDGFSEQEMSIFNLLKSALIRPVDTPLIANFASLVAEEASEKARPLRKEERSARNEHPNRETSPSGERQSGKPAQRSRPNSRPPSKDNGEEQRNSAESATA
ncbi:MAG: hypothetical protein WA532_05870 [Candidatus Korobacteraceae bacterium]